ncbi:Low density lipoprotein receptor class A domain-containing 1 [Apodemus speciosus]|uniref:Low density lipoprotein receptor class A domain-containing 1 n=1 Tax=Apodemus speciosus TaxID=105296 RepID=A0ABQ0EPE6_APOSI
MQRAQLRETYTQACIFMPVNGRIFPKPLARPYENQCLACPAHWLPMSSTSMVCHTFPTATEMAQQGIPDGKSQTPGVLPLATRRRTLHRAHFILPQFLEMSVRAMNKVFPQADAESNTATGGKARPGDEESCGPLCCSRRGACLSVSLLLLLAMLAALLAVATVLGHPPRTPETHSCVTSANRTGFLCHDRRHCIPAHSVCDGIRTCPHGEDEAKSLCRDVPQSLPSFLLTTCGDPDSWIYSDQKCDGTNNCGDCSDELSPGDCVPALWPWVVALHANCVHILQLCPEGSVPGRSTALL